MKTVAIYPGSFNPFHKGHEAVLRKALQVFDRVIIAIGINPDKKDNGTLQDICGYIIDVWGYPPSYIYKLKYLEKWDGKLPTVMTGGNTSLMMTLDTK